MNIFKVIASGKKSFQEETASAIIAWFLNPTMEHGLGYSFLSRFVEELSKSNTELKIAEFGMKLTPKLNSEQETQLNFWCNLEYHVETAFIDIALGIENWIFAIENKIYSQSHQDGQLQKQYDQLKKKHPDSHAGIIYLVPIEAESELLDGRIERDFEGLSITRNDFKAIVTWQENRIEDVPSISDIIIKILEDENKGVIDPVSEYTRHTLKALNSFISNGFSGYEYQSSTQSSGLNPLTEDQLSVDVLNYKTEGYVGVKGGMRGLLKIEEKKLLSHKFQYTSHDMSNKNFWLDIETFNNIIKWILRGEVNDIEWNGRLSSEALYKIARDFGKKVFIGIKGGKNALEKMQPYDIRKKEWSISTMQANPQWIDGEIYRNILDKKDVY